MSLAANCAWGIRFHANPECVTIGQWSVSFTRLFYYWFYCYQLQSRSNPWKPLCNLQRFHSVYHAIKMKSLPYAIALGLIYIKCIVAFVLKVVWSHIPVLKNKLQKFEEESNRVPYQNFWDVYGGRKHFVSIVKILVGDLNKVAKLGFSAPNCTVATVDGKECKLLDFTKGNRPLVLNFGSCTWPPFLVTFVKDFETVVHNFDKVADFLTVYISEAHPTDDWRWNVSTGYHILLCFSF